MAMAFGGEPTDDTMYKYRCNVAGGVGFGCWLAGWLGIGSVRR
jgi:hypothetical protein